MIKSTKTVLVAMSLLLAGVGFTACGGETKEETPAADTTTVAPAPADTTMQPAADSTAPRDSASTRPVTPGN